MIPTPPESADWNVADAGYLTMMIAHHRQALDLADLAETRAEDRQVLAIARSIDRGQSREIIAMVAWLVRHDLPEPMLADLEAVSAMPDMPDMPDMPNMSDMTGMAGMQGMLSPTQMQALEDADGAAFDELFLTGMIAHHQGAIAMADTLVRTGEDVRVREMATDVIATQHGEISRLAALLDG
ncbi:DUF305 domain-containing protein [Nocardioides sp.]|uniref:DUF305 domain-containing protein n=1 Tax=Nocardioides sp. TaxID=35761 RepID=UPI002B264EFD|nr:DUF305 domain-containing protein [Nocardioides sp.]